jgi:uncharacterized membrane protein
MSAEEWRAVVGFPGYEVSDLGRVRSLDRIDSRSRKLKGRILKQFRDGDDRYPFLRLSRDGNAATIRVHVLVLEAFTGPRPAGFDACHNDGDKLNNTLANLRWDSKSENMLDVVRHGHHQQLAKTHCPHGHPYAGENLVFSSSPNRRLGRRCLECRRKTNRESTARARAARRALAAANTDGRLF